MTATVGIAERAERLIIVLVGTGLDRLADRTCPYVQAIALWVLVAASTITVGAAVGHRLPAVARRAPPTAERDLAAHRAEPAARRWPVDAGFAAGWALVKARARAAGRAAAFRPAADLAVRRDGAGVRQLRANLRRVVGPASTEPSSTSWSATAMRSYARYWLETFRLPKMDHGRDRCDRRPRHDGAQHIDEAVAAGRGYVLALPHMGNWDVAGIWLIDRTASRSRPWPSGSSPSRCSTGSSPTARAWAWRCCR